MLFIDFVLENDKGCPMGDLQNHINYKMNGEADFFIIVFTHSFTKFVLRIVKHA